MDEQELINQALNGNTESFDKLVSRHLNIIRSLLQINYFLCASDIDDIVQIGMFQAWKNLVKFKGESSFSTWFYSICFNTAKNFLSNRNKIDRFEVKGLKLQENQDGEFELAEHGKLEAVLENTAYTVLESKEKIDIIKDKIKTIKSKLKPIHSEILDLLLQEKSYKEISQHLSIPIGTVMSRVYFTKYYTKKALQYESNSKI